MHWLGITASATQQTRCLYDMKSVCKLRRRPVGQATRYGEWYTGNDTDLDEQLLEYNAEQARAASAAGLQLERRKSDLASYAADKDDANFTDGEAEEAAHKRSSHLRRSTIAPGQVCYKFPICMQVMAGCCIAPAYALGAVHYGVAHACFLAFCRLCNMQQSNQELAGVCRTARECT